MKAVNLLPSEQRGSAKTPAAAPSPATGGSAFGAYVVLGALAFAVAALALYTLANNVIKDRKVELAQVTQEATETQAKAASLQAYADFKTMAGQRLNTVKALADARFDWERTLGDLARAVPSDVHLTSLNGTVGTQLSGGSSSGLRGAVQAPALELQGCTASQPSVARLMSRLRTVRGVTRVSLAKSDKDGNASSGAVTPSATGGTPAQLCPKGAPPAFDVVVFFERATVSPNAAPNTGTGAAVSTTGSAAAAASTTSSTTTSTSTSTGAATTTTTGTTSTSTTQGVSSK